MSLRSHVLAYFEQHRSVAQHYSTLLHSDALLGVRIVYEETCLTDAEKQEFIGALLKDTDANLLLTIARACPTNSIIRQWLCTPGPATERGAFVCEFRSVAQLFEFAVGSQIQSHEVATLSCHMFNDVCTWLSSHDGVNPDVHLVGAQVCDPLRHEFLVYRCCPYYENRDQKQKTAILMTKESWFESAVGVQTGAYTQSPPPLPATIWYRNIRKRRQQKRATVRLHAALVAELKQFVHALL